MAFSRKLLNDSFAAVEIAAITEQRCPQNEPFGPLKSGVLTRLARAGRIKVEIYALNWRVVTILSGPHTGTRTKPAPRGAKPYKVVEKDDAPLQAQRQKPWSPGLAKDGEAS